jgi:hypothetical protein
MAISNLFRIFVYNKQLVNLKQTTMKKVVFAAVVALTIGLTSCGNGKTEATGTTDSTVVDSTAVTAVDSTTAQIPADSTSTK